MPVKHEITVAERTLMRRMFDEGESFARIGQSIGLSKAFARIAIKKAGWVRPRLPKGPKRDAKSEQTIIELRKAGKTTPEIVLLTGRSKSVVGNVLMTAGLTKHVPPLTKNQIALAIGAFHSGKTLKQVGEMFSRNSVTIWNVLRKNGVSRPKGAIRHGRFTNEKDSEIRRLYDLNHTVNEVSAAVDRCPQYVAKVLKKSGQLRGHEHAVAMSAESNAQRMEGIRLAGERPCSNCGVVKPLAEFTPNGKSLGVGAQCKLCSKEKTRGFLSRLRVQMKEESLDLATHLSYCGQRFKQYGMTVSHFIKMYNEQGGKCASCGTEISNRPGSSRYNTHVDHCHKTHRVRGLLCGPCNVMLGVARDNPAILRRAAIYLEADTAEQHGIAINMSHAYWRSRRAQYSPNVITRRQGRGGKPAAMRRAEEMDSIHEAIRL